MTEGFKLTTKMILVILALFLFIISSLSVVGDGENNTDTITSTGPNPPPDLIMDCRLDSSKGVVKQKVIDDVPAYGNWHHGCTPTSIAMILGCWDGRGFDDLIPGSARYQTVNVNNAIASKGDGSDTTSDPGTPGSGHVPDYAYYNGVNDGNWDNPEPDMSELDPENAHGDDCIADFLKTSRSEENLRHGWTSLGHVANGFINYCNWANSQYQPVAKFYGWDNNINRLNWSNYCKEIDLNRPTKLTVHTTGGLHSIVGLGYKELDDGSQYYGFYNTWDTSLHWEPFKELDGDPWTITSAFFFDIKKPDPVSCFTAIPTKIDLGDTAEFNGSYSYSPNNQIVNYTWDFGDGIFGYTKEISHEYNSEGEYTISLKVTDGNGLSSTTTKTVSVIGPDGLLAINQSKYIESYEIYENMKAAQSFTSDGFISSEKISFIKVNVNKVGSPEADLKIELRNGSTDGELIQSILFSRKNISQNNEWIDVDIDDTIVDPKVPYFIVLSCEQEANSDNCYRWNYFDSNEYRKGMFWYTSKNLIWYSDSEKDFAFKIYYSVEPNEMPETNTDSYYTLEDESISILEPDLLINDYDPDNGPNDMSVVELLGPKHGFLDLNSDGSFEYIPERDYYGLDYFYYQVSDGWELSKGEKVTIDIEPVNDPTYISPDNYFLTEGETFTLDEPGVLMNDYDADGNLIAIKTSDSQYGSLNLKEDGSLTYTTFDSDYYGSDTFTYQVFDGEYYSEDVNVYLHISGVNDPPVANDNFYILEKNEELIVPFPGVLENDTDVEYDQQISVQLVENVEEGTLTLNTDGSFRYTPPENWTGVTIFTYRANDSTDHSNIAQVTIEVVENAPPKAINDGYVLNKNQNIIVDSPGMLENDIDYNKLEAELIGNAEQGTLTLNTDGSFRYIPPENWTGIDSFIYRAYDGENYSNPAVVKLTVTDNIEVIDINQSNLTRGSPLLCNYIISQSFKPTYNVLSHIDLYMQKVGDPLENVKIQLRKGEINGEIVYEGLIYPDDLPESQGFGWIAIDIPDIGITPGETFFILVSSNFTNNHNTILVGRNSLNGYEEGFYATSKDEGETWQYELFSDMTFRTYSKMQNQIVYSIIEVVSPDIIELGNNFNSTINVSFVKGLSNGNFDINFNSSVLNILDVTSGMISENAVEIEEWYFIDTDTVHVVIDVSEPEGITGSGYITKIQFQSISEGRSDISLSNMILTDISDKEIPTFYESKTIEVIQNEDTHTLTINIEGAGTVTKDPDQTTYTNGTNVTLTAIPDDNNHIFHHWTGDITGHNSTRTITMDSNKEITANFSLRGDVNGDGLVGAADITYIQEIMFENLDDIKPADVNNDGETNIEDIQSIEQILLGYTLN